MRRSPCIRIECVGRIVVEQQRTGIDDRGQRVAFGLPARVEAIEFGSGGSNVVLDRVAPRRITGTERAFAPDPLLFDAQAVDAAARIFDRRGYRVLTDGDARAGRIEQADRLVRQLAGGNVTVRQRDGGLQRIVEHEHAVVGLELPGEAAQHRQRGRFLRFMDVHELEASRQRRVLLDVLLVLGPRGRADRAQQAAGERGLQQVRGVAGAGGPPARRRACGLRR